MICCSIALFSCNTTKKSLETNVVKKLSVSELQRAVEKHNVDFEWFSGKAKITVARDGAKMGARIQIRMQKDQLIWMSISKLGFEVMRAKITPDSAYIIDRFNRDYYVESLEDYLKEYKVPFSFQELQGLMLGNIPYQKGRRATSKIDVNQYYYSHITRNDWFFEYQIDPKLAITGLFVSDPDEREVVSRLGGYAEIDHRQIPMYISHEINDGAEFVAMQLDYTSAEFDIQKNTPFEVPSHYTRID